MICNRRHQPSRFRHPGRPRAAITGLRCCDAGFKPPASRVVACRALHRFARHLRVHSAKKAVCRQRDVGRTPRSAPEISQIPKDFSPEKRSRNLHENFPGILQMVLPFSKFLGNFRYPHWKFAKCPGNLYANFRGAPATWELRGAPCRRSPRRRPCPGRRTRRCPSARGAGRTRRCWCWRGT